MELSRMKINLFVLFNLGTDRAWGKMVHNESH